MEESKLMMGYISWDYSGKSPKENLVALLIVKSKLCNVESYLVGEYYVDEGWVLLGVGYGGVVFDSSDRNTYSVLAWAKLPDVREVLDEC
jgi:hypothetical protein